MSPYMIAAALIAGEIPDVSDLIGYWRTTDNGERPKAETVAVLAALSAVGPRGAAAMSFVQYVDENYPAIRLSASERAVNIVGTGGGQRTFNISTTSAFVAAAAGATILKSGSSAYSSLVGAGDLLAAFDLGRPMSDEDLDHMLETVGIGFAPSSRYAAVCKRLAIAAMPLPFKVIGRFVNSIGPLICPYATRASLVGVPNLGLYEMIGETAKMTGRRVLLAHSEHHVDELLSIGSNIFGWADQAQERLAPAEWGLAQGAFDKLNGGDLSHNVYTLETILKGKGSTIQSQTVALNAGAALYSAGHTGSIREGMKAASECMRDGAPFQLLQRAMQFARDIPSSPMRAVR